MSKNLKEITSVLERRQLAKKRAQQYNLFSDLFVSIALNDTKACEHVLRIIMDKPDLAVKQVDTQETISRIEARGVRLGVLAEDSEGRIFNIEIQKAATVDHARRIRLYSSMIDSDLLERGQSFDQMPTLVMIYISETNIWQFNGAVSRVLKIWADNEKVFDDGLEIIGVNAVVNDGSRVAALMAYFKTADPKDQSQGELSKRVRFLKAEGGLQMVIDKMDINYIEGVEEGKIATALKMLSRDSYSVEEIVDITELSIEKVLELKEKNSK